MKITWDEIWINLAKNISLKSKDPRLKVGAIIVTEDNESVLAIGYNGDEIGGPNIPDSLEPGQSNFLHAEVNAIAKLNYSDPRKRKIYLTHSPCKVCSRLIINAKIDKVYFCDEYRDKSGLDILKERGILVVQQRGWE